LGLASVNINASFLVYLTWETGRSGRARTPDQRFWKPKPYIPLHIIR